MQKKISKRLVSFFIVITLIFSMFSTITSAFYINNKNIDTKNLNLKSNFKEKLENIKEKLQTSTETKYSSFYNDLSLFSILRTIGLDFYTNYNGMEKNYNLRIFKTIKIDVNNDSVNDFSVRTLIYPGIEFPFSLSFNVKLVVRSLNGYNSLDENAFFQSYVKFYRPGILFKESKGDSICFGYESPINNKIPENIELTYKFIPNLFNLKKTPEHKLVTNLISKESNLSVLFSYTSLENGTIETEHNLKILYEPLKKSSISFRRTGNSSIEFKRDDSTSSYITLFYEKRQDENSTFFYVKDVPSYITFTADIGRDGLIEFDTHGEAAKEIGIVDNFEKPQNSIYFTNLFSKAGISWHRDRFLFITKGVENLSVYSDGKDVGTHVYLTGLDEGFVNFEAISHQALNCSFELNLDESYLRLLRSSVDLSLSLNVEIKNETLGNFVNKLYVSCDIKQGFDGPITISFKNLKSGAGNINLAGKSFDISNLIMTCSSPMIGGNFTVSMEKLVKEKEGTISFDFSIEQKDNNMTGSCFFRVKNGVKITELSLVYNDFEFHRENIDVSGDIVRWYNFSLNVSVEWHVYKDWGYVLVKNNGFASFSFNSLYTNETGVLIGRIYGIISFKLINKDFNISWRKVDGNYTFSFDGRGVANLKDFNLWIKDKIEVSIREMSLSFNIDTDAKAGSLKLYLDDTFISGDINIENINITNLYNFTLKCSINAALDFSASGFIDIGWNESGKTTINGDLGVKGLIDITDFVFKYKTLVDISASRLFISGDLDFIISSIDGNLSITVNAGITDILFSDLNINCSIITPIAISADMNITFNGGGVINLSYENNNVLISGAIYDDADIVINSLWFIVPFIPIEINLESVYLNGSTNILFKADFSKDIPVTITFYSDSQITAKTVYIGYPGVLQLFIYDFIGGGTGGNIGIGFNMATSKPVFDLNHSSFFIGDLQFMIEGNLIPLSNLSIQGSAHLEGFLDILSFTYVYLNGEITEDTTISFKNMSIPKLGSHNVSIVLKPGKLDLVLQLNLDNGEIYAYGDSTGWITFKIDNTDLAKLMGTLDLGIHLEVSTDGTISAVIYAKQASCAIIFMDKLRVVGEINAVLEFSVKIVQDKDSITISNLYVNITGELSAVVQIRANETDWIPIIPSGYSNQVVIFRQGPGLMDAPNIASDFEAITEEDNASLTFEVWYTPSYGKGTNDIGPYTYNVSFGDGTYYEVTTYDTRIVTPSHLYNLDGYKVSVTVKPFDSAIDAVYDDLSFKITKRITYMEKIENGPNSFTYYDVEDDGRLHTWFTIGNKDDKDYILHWEAFNQLDFDGNPIFDPETGVLNPGETVRVNVSFIPPSDYKKHVFYLGAYNTNYPIENVDQKYITCTIVPTLSVLPSKIYLPSLSPNSSINSSIWIWNNKKDKVLNWAITDYPNDNYSFSSIEGSIPPGSAEIVHFTIKAPNVTGLNLGGEINVTDVDDPVFYGIALVNVKTKGVGSDTNGNVTITQTPNGNASIAIGGYNEIHINNFKFQINGITGMINGDFIFVTNNSYVFINWTKGDLSNLSIDGNAVFSIENFAFSYGENINIVVSRIITGGLHCSEGRKGNFTLVVDDTFANVSIDAHFNNSYSNFTLSGNIDIDIDSFTNGTLVINWDLESGTKNISIDGNLLHTSKMKVLITDFILQFNNFTLNAGLIYFNRTVFISFNETGLNMESGSAIQAEDIYLSLNGGTQLITINASVDIDGYVTFQFKPWNNGFMFCINTSGFKVNGWIYIEFGEYHGSAHIFWKIFGWFCIGLETG